MSPSRRAMLGLLGASALGAVSGCTAPGSLGGQPSDQSNSPKETGATPFEIRLSGPEDERIIFDANDVETVGDVRDRDDVYSLSIELTDDATAAVSETFRTMGVDEDPDAFEIVQRQDGEEVSRLGITPPLAERIAGGEWDGSFVVTASERERAEELRETLSNEGAG